MLVTFIVLVVVALLGLMRFLYLFLRNEIQAHTTWGDLSNRDCWLLKTSLVSWCLALMVLIFGALSNI